MTTAPLSRSSLILHLLAGQAPLRRIHLDLGGEILEIAVNEPALALELERYFAAFRTEARPPELSITAVEAPLQKAPLNLSLRQRAPGKTPHESYADLPDGRVVQKQRTGMLFIFGQGQNLVIGPCLEHFNQVVNFVGNRLIERLLHRGGLPVHAAAAGMRGRALAFSGPAGAGKSSLALHLLSRGADFVANDRAVLLPDHGGVSIRGEPKTARVNPGTALSVPGLAQVMPPADRRRYQATDPAELWSVEHKYTAHVDRLFGPGRFQLRAALAGLVFLEWQGFDAPCRIEPAEPGERARLMEMLKKSPGLFFHPAEQAGQPPDWPTAAYLELLEGAPAYTARGGVDFSAAAAFCMELLEKCDETV
ncbi:MAG: HprK-related kinase B [Desulfovibrionaceae bacterium]